MIDIVLVDDHRLFRDGLRRLLQTDGRFRVVGEAADGAEFLALFGPLLDARSTDPSPARPLRQQPPPPASGMRFGTPDNARSTDPSPAGSLRQQPLVFMDIDMPGMGGIEATRHALVRWPELRVVALSMHGEEEFFAPMMAAGAVGFLMKDSTLEQVAAAAFAALGLPPTDTLSSPTGQAPELVGGRRPELAEGVETLSPRERGSDGRNEPAASSSRFHPPLDELSVREREVLPLICAGLSTQQIAERLFISPRTVDKHRASILSKTASPNTASLVVWAVRHGLISI